MELKPTTTLAELTAYISQHTKKGIHCPVCNGMVKLYKRKINKSNAICLKEMYEISEKFGYRFYHITEMMALSPDMAVKLNGGEFARMRHWGFIEELPKNGFDDKKASGYWKMTERGKSFCRNELKVHKNILLLNNQVLGFAGKEVDINACLKFKFSFTELMQETKTND